MVVPCLRAGLAGLAVLLASVVPTRAAEPPTTPFLRIETGLHTASVNRLSTDADARIAATASDDKTVRLWKVADGSRIAILRVPVEAGSIGALYAVALSPDGRSLVTSGDTGRWDGAPVLYLFNVETQALRARLVVPSQINHLSWSPDGRYFAAGFGGTAGIRIWDAKTGRVVAEDKGYRARTTWIAFDRSGRMATASFDGELRLYDESFKLVAKRKAPSGRLPFSLDFSPDGAMLAVGYADQAKVDVVSGRDLAPRFSPNTSDLRQGNLAAVAWSHDAGALQLLAGGTVLGRDGRVIVRRWVDFGMGPATDIPVTRDSINQILGLPGGGALYASADPSWGRIAEGGVPHYYLGGSIGDFRDIADGRFALSQDGMTVDFGMAKGGRDPYRFDFRSRKFLHDPPPNPAMAGPLVQSARLKLTDWKNSTAPKLGRTKLPLDSTERSLSLAIAPDERSFLLGTDFYLRLYDSRGIELRRVAVPGAVWGVVVSGDGRVAVAALGDGTLRWFGLAPGRELEELTALFPDPDGKRWVSWLPEAFFDHSDLGGKELVGFLLNQGKNRVPDWVDFSQLYRLYYAPELILAKLSGRGIAEIQAHLARIGDVRARLDQRPLPGIELVEYCLPESRGFARVAPGTPSTAPPAPQVQPTTDARGCAPIDVAQASRGLTVVPTEPAAPAAPAGGNAAAFTANLPTGTASIMLTFKVADRGGGIGAVDIFLNDRNISRETVSRGFARVREQAPAAPPAAAPGPAAAGELITRTIPLDAGPNRIFIRAYESSGSVFERSAAIELTAPAQKQQQQVAQTPTRPRLFVLAAGINRYQGDGVPPLRYAVADAKAFVGAIRSRSAPLYGEIFVTELYDEQATPPAIAEGLARLAKESLPDDTALIYLAGHGIANLPQFGIDRYYFVTQNVSSVRSLTTEALPEDRLVELISRIRAKNSFLFLDTCHAGALTNDDAAKIGHEAGRYVLAASASLEEALDSYDGHNGLMAYALVKALEGGADANREGIISNFNVGLFVQEEVAHLADEKRWQQQAVFKISSEGARPFPMAKIR
ncbi:MAG: hypothetical protein GC191_04505 [Azospirillum sp.]|nr:hypothetical protein [Azospirillum sp.]